MAMTDDQETYFKKLVIWGWIFESRAPDQEGFYPPRDAQYAESLTRKRTFDEAVKEEFGVTFVDGKVVE